MNSEKVCDASYEALRGVGYELKIYVRNETVALILQPKYKSKEYNLHGA